MEEEGEPHAAARARVARRSEQQGDERLGADYKPRHGVRDRLHENGSVGDPLREAGHVLEEREAEDWRARRVRAEKGRIQLEAGCGGIEECQLPSHPRTDVREALLLLLPTTFLGPEHGGERGGIGQGKPVFGVPHEGRLCGACGVAEEDGGG